MDDIKKRLVTPNGFSPVQVPALILRLGTEVRTAFDRRLAPFDLTMQQAALLLHGADQTPAQVAAVLGTDAAGMTRLVDRLERRGLLRRVSNPSDRRSILLEPTAEAVAMLPDLRRTFKETVCDLMRGFSPSEAEAFLALLRRFAANVQDAPPPPSGSVDA